MDKLVYDWLEKSLPCFIPVLLVLSRYHSFGRDYKKPIYDIIADPQFCVTPMLLSFGTVLNLFKKRGSFNSETEIISSFCLVFALLLLCWNILIYWDLTFEVVQKDDDVSVRRKRSVSGQTGNTETAFISDKKKKMKMISILWTTVLILSFVTDVIL